MVMMPTIAEGDERYQKIVAAVVGCRIAPRSVAVADRICRPDRMIHTDRTDNCPPDDELQAVRASSVVQRAPCLATRVQHQRICQIYRVRIALEKHQLTKPGEVGHEMPAYAHATRREQPAHVAPEKPASSILIGPRLVVRFEC